MNSKSKAKSATNGGDHFEPERRFVEFQNEGTWTTMPLASVAEISTQKVRGKSCIPMSITSGVGLVSQMEKFGRVIAGDSYKNYLLLKRHDFAYNKSATKEYPEGYIALYTGEELAAVPNSIFTCFRINEEFISPQYLDYLFSRNLHGHWLRKFIEVGARAHGSLSINDSDLMALPVPVPAGPKALKEQKKIADCLASSDALIKAQQRKVEALRAHRKGLMQQLFPQPERVENGVKVPAETFPRLRFTEFQNSEHWKVMTIQDMLDDHLIAGHLDGNHGELYPKAEEFSPNNQGVPYISANDFLNGIVDFSKCKRLPIARARLFKKGVARDGDILFAHNATVGPVAKLETNEEFVILSTTATYFRCNTKKLSNEFLKFALSSPAFVAQYTPVMAQSTRNQVPITTQRTLRLHVPERAEQQRIAECLTSLDKLIAAESRKLNTLKVHKKGLMQQLFPVVGEDDA